MESDEQEKAKIGFQDIVKKVITTGIGAAFMTEESIRHVLGEVKLPKEVLSSLLHGAQKSKDDLMARVGDEILKMVKKIDFVQEASKFVENHKFRISAEIEVLKKNKTGESESTQVTQSGESTSAFNQTPNDPRITVK